MSKRTSLRRTAKEEERRLSPTAVEKYRESRGKQPRQKDKVSKSYEVEKEVQSRGELEGRHGSSHPGSNA